MTCRSRRIAASFLKTAGVAGAAGARGRRRARQVRARADRLGPGATGCPAEADAPRNGGRRNGAPTTRPAPRTTSPRRRCSTPPNGSRTARSTRSAASTSRACRFSAQRAFTLRIPGGPTGGPFGENKLVYHDEFLATEIGQTGTQFDGLGHIGIQMGKDGDKSEMHFYNGFTAAADSATPMA